MERINYILSVEGSKDTLSKIEKMLREEFMNNNSLIEYISEENLLFKANINSFTRSGIFCGCKNVIKKIDEISVCVLVKCVTCNNSVDIIRDDNIYGITETIYERLNSIIFV